MQGDQDKANYLTSNKDEVTAPASVTYGIQVLPESVPRPHNTHIYTSDQLHCLPAVLSLLRSRMPLVCRLAAACLASINRGCRGSVHCGELTPCAQHN